MMRSIALGSWILAERERKAERGRGQAAEEKRAEW
jgi:hypothetical protein